MANSAAGSSRPTMTLTPDQREHFRILAEQADAERAELPDRFRQVDSAANQDTFSGALRRAIHECPWDLAQLEQRTKIPAHRLADFLQAAIELQTSEVDTLVQTLSLELVKPLLSPRDSTLK